MITLTSTMIIPNITKTSSNNCILAFSKCKRINLTSAPVFSRETRNLKVLEVEYLLLLHMAGPKFELCWKPLSPVLTLQGLRFRDVLRFTDKQKPRKKLPGERKWNNMFGTTGWIEPGSNWKRSTFEQLNWPWPLKIMIFRNSGPLLALAAEPFSRLHDFGERHAGHFARI